MITKKDPPDKYKCLKLPLSYILPKYIDNDNITILQDAIFRANNITSKTYLLLRLWVLEKYHNTQQIPKITENTISMCMKSIIIQNGTKPPTKDNTLLLEEFKNLNTFELENGKHLSAVLRYYATTMLTSIENNIKNHFFDYIKRFVNSYFKHIYQEEIKDKKFKNILFKELNILKNDLFNNTLTCDQKYHEWLTENRFKIVPHSFEINYAYDIKIEPHKYLKHMIFMCLELEKIERKSFQFFPLQTNGISRHIQIDTKALIELFVQTKKHQDLLNNCIKDKTKTKTKQNLFTCIEENKTNIWATFFNIGQKINNYEFDHTIITDGFCVSLRFIHVSFIEEQKEKHKKMREGKKLKKEQNEKIKENKIKIKSEKTNKEEFLYIDEVPKEKLGDKHIFIDPGKKSLLTMVDDKGKFFSYKNKVYLRETKRLKYQALLKHFKDKTKITQIEKNLNGFNSKTCDLHKFKEYIDKKIETNKLTIPLYQHQKFRQYKWYSYINTKRAQDKLLRKMSRKYGKDHKIIIGDWSIGKQMRHFIPTPNLTLKRKLKERFEVFNIDEFRTSCLCCKTEEVCGNLYLKFKNDPAKKKRKLHSVLTYKMENKRLGCMNRDKNGCENIQKIFNSYIETGERPERYRREVIIN